MDWDDIRFFLAVARGGSITRAASTLEVNYTTVSRRLAAFEAKLELQLFERSGKQYTLTPSGEVILEAAIAMAENAARVERAAQGQDQKLSGRLRLTTSDTVATQLVIPRLSAFTERHPQIVLDISTDDSLRNLDLREADVALRMTPAPPEHLIGRRIANIGYGVYASKRYLSRHPRLDSAEVRLLPWLYDREHPSWATDEFPRATVGLRFDQAFPLLQAIEADLGLGLLPHFVASSRPKLVQVNREPVNSDWQLWLLHHPDLKTTARLRAFRDFLVEQLGELSGVIEGCNSTPPPPPQQPQAQQEAPGPR